MLKKFKVLGWLVALVVAGIISTSERPAQAQVYVRIAPPALRVETRGRPPSRSHVWVGGYHRWTGRAYAWSPGRWTVVRSSRGWRWVPGHWR
jgi:hypothetical protein